MSKGVPTNTSTTASTNGSSSTTSGAQSSTTAPATSTGGVRSAWSKGPPPATSSSAAATPNASNPPSNANTRPSSVTGSPNLGAVNQPNGVNGVSGKGDGKKASLLAIGADGKQGGGGTKPMNIARGPTSAINFGSIDSPTTQLSSSPAAPTSTGNHLPSGLQSFGSIEAEKAASGSGGGQQGAQGHARKMSNMSGLVIPPFQGGKTSPAGSTTGLPATENKASSSSSASPAPTPAANTTTETAPANAPKKFNPHALFQSAGGSQTPAPSMASATSPPPQGPPSGMYPPPSAQQGGRPTLQQSHGYDPQGRPLLGGSAQFIPGMPMQQPFPGMSPYPQHQQGMPQYRPGPGQPPLPVQRSPSMSHQQPNFNPQFRPGQQQGGPQQGGPARSGASGLSPRPQHQQLPSFGGMHPAQMGYPGMPYGQQGFYAYAQNPYEQQGQYMGPPQWQGQSRPGGGYPGAGMPLSPRNVPSSLPGNSPAPSHAGIQSGTPGSPSPALTSARPASGQPIPHSLSHTNSGLSTTASSQSSIPGTPNQVPARPLTFQPPSFTGHLSPLPAGQAPPGSPMAASLSAGASAFTPRAKSAIKISRPDGTAFDIAAAATAAKSNQVNGSTTSSAPASEAESTVTPSSVETPAPKVKAGLPYKPVVVRLETEAQKEARLAEEAKERKIKEIEQKEEDERKERKAREEKEKAEKAEKAEKEKKDAEQKAEEERIAKEKADADAAIAKEAEKKADGERVRKAEEEKKAEEARKDAETKAKADDDSQAKEEAATAPKEESKPDLLAPLASSSATSSPLASPSLAHAGLPAKPTAAFTARRPTPASLDLAPASSAPPSPTIASASATSSARAIEDINSITYPSSLRSPDPSLNVDASPGKFRYDRTFLLQFMDVCKEKPETLPPLAVIGMEAETGNFGARSSRGGVSRNQSSQTGMPRGGMGLGIGSMTGQMGQFAGKGAGIGAFGTGNFGSARGSTSEERLAAANNRMQGAGSFGGRNSSSGMARTPSQTGTMGSMSSMSIRRAPGGGSSRGKPRPEARAPQAAQLEPGVAPLEQSLNRWKPTAQAKKGGAGQPDENSPEFVERKVKALLNKLTKEKFESISNQILEWANKSANEKDGQTLRLVIKLIFEKAKDEQFWSEMYAQLCVKLHQELSNDVQDELMTEKDGTPISGGQLFRKYLLGRCQEDFEKGWKKREDASVAAKTKADVDAQKKADHEKAVAGGQQVEEFKFSDEYYAEQTAKRQGLGLVKFVGELFKLGQLSTKIIVACIRQLLMNVVDPDEEDVESLCQLLSTAGEGLDKYSSQSSGTVSVFMQRMEELSRSEHISSRIKFMVLDVIELRRNGWKGRKASANAGPMTIEEVHRAAQKEQQDAARAAAMAPRGDSMSRGGSRRGDQRAPFPGGQGGPGGPEGWTPVGNRAPAKAADMSHFGKIKSGGPQTFGPSSVFASKKSGRSGDATPPLSRTSSSANMFGALASAGEGPASGEVAGPSSESSTSAAAADAGPQRKKLVLAPRTTPKEGEGEDEEDEDEELAANTGDDTAAGTGGDFEGSSMTKEDVERKITADLKELWGEKDTLGTRRPEDIVEYFSYLPEGARPMLASKLVDEVFRIAKKADTEIVANGIEMAVDQGLITSDVVKESLVPSVELLDDLAVDIPLAYTFTAEVIVAAGLSQPDIEELADKIEELGEAMIKPKDKLLRAVAKVQAEKEDGSGEA